MGEYEYRVEKLGSLRDSKRLSKLITSLGADGWELVDKQAGGLVFGYARVTFRRPKVDVVPVPVPVRVDPGERDLVAVGFSGEPGPKRGLFGRRKCRTCGAGIRSGDQDAGTAVCANPGCASKSHGSRYLV